MIAEEWITLSTDWLRDKPGNAGKLLFYLMAKCITAKENAVQASDRTLTAELYMSRDALTAAKRCIAQIITVEAPDRLLTTYRLPQHWFDSQPSLFSSGSVLINRAGCPENQDTARPGKQDSLSWKMGQAVLKSRTPVLKSGADLAGNSGHTVLENRTGVLNIRTADTGNQQVAGGSSIDSNQESVVITREVALKIDRVLDCVEIPSALRSDGEMLSRSLHAFMQQRGNSRAAQTPPKMEHVAKCLAIAPLEPLLTELMKLSREGNHCPGSYIWFVVVFLDRFLNVPWKITKLRMDERRQRKQPAREVDHQFTADLFRQAASNVRTMR